MNLADDEWTRTQLASTLKRDSYTGFIRVTNVHIQQFGPVSLFSDRSSLRAPSSGGMWPASARRNTELGVTNETKIKVLTFVFDTNIFRLQVSSRWSWESSQH